jgi:hypothetical protein
VYFFIDSNSIMISQDCSSVKKVCQMVDWVDHRRFPSYVPRYKRFKVILICS